MLKKRGKIISVVCLSVIAAFATLSWDMSQMTPYNFVLNILVWGLILIVIL